MYHRESEEMYLETILLLEKDNEHIRRVDIAEALGYSRPSVTNAMKSLKAKGWICEGDSGRIQLTEEGRDKAVSIYEKHHLVTKLLIHIGAEPSAAEENACRIEHVISSDLMDVIRRFMTESHAMRLLPSD